MRIAIFGDCIPAGTQVQEQERYPYLIKKHLEEKLKIDVDVIDAAVPGDSTIGGIKRVEDQVIKQKPDIVLMGFGINDGLPRARGRFTAALMKRIKPEFLRSLADNLFKKARPHIMKYTGGTVYVTQQQFRKNINKLVDVIEAKTEAKVVLLTTTICTRPEFPGANENFRKYNEVLFAIAKERNTPIIDLFYPLMDFQPEDILVDDLLHLNPRGHALVADIIKQRLEQITIDCIEGK